MSNVLNQTQEVLTDSNKIVTDALEKIMKVIMDNELYYGLLVLFLAMYGPRLSPKLPGPIKNLFNNNLFRFVIIVLIIFISNKDLKSALIITILFITFISLTSSFEMEEHMISNNLENFSEYDLLSSQSNNKQSNGPETFISNNDDCLTPRPPECEDDE
tara:strand:+ start:255 stop:731 length:477 start_codon:yes stop_codon:yes gene_type:complete